MISSWPLARQILKPMNYFQSIISGFFNNGSIRHRIQKGYLVLLSLIASIMVMSLLYLQQQHVNFIHHSEEDRLARWSNASANLAYNQANETLGTYFLTFEKQHLNDYQSHITHSKQLLSRFLSLINNTQLEYALIELIRLNDELIKMSELNISLSKQGFPRSAHYLWEQDHKAIRDEVIKLHVKVNDILDHQVRGTIQSAIQQERRIFTFNLIVISICILLCLLIAIHITRGVETPIKSLCHMTKQIAKGNLNAHIEVQEKNEFSELFDSINQMSSNIKYQLHSSQQSATIKERERIARDIHDELSQTLFSTKLLAANLTMANTKLSSKQKHMTEQLYELVQQAHHQLKLLLSAMLNGKQESTPLNQKVVDCLTYYKKHFAGQIISQIDCVSGADQRIEWNLLHIFKEAMNNIIKHSQSSSVEISLINHREYISLTIIDNGIGIDEIESSGIGLSNIRQRAKEINAVLTIRNNNPGTIVQAMLKRGLE